MQIVNTLCKNNTDAYKEFLCNETVNFLFI